MTTELPPNTIRERTDAPHNFTEGELAGLGKKLQAFRREQTQVEAQFDSVKADFKARLSRIETDQDDTGRKISDGFEMRPVDALVTFHDPQQNRKTYRREDTGETIREESMSATDYECPLFKNKDNTDATQPELPAGEPVVQSPPPFEDEDGAKVELENHGPVGTPMGDALDQAASLTDAPLLVLDLSKLTVEGQLITAYRNATKKAGWSVAQFSMLLDQLKACETVSRMREVLAPHCQQ